MSDPKLA